MTKMPVQTIALDLEGTLISNAVSIFPRPGLYDFLEFCHSAVENVILFTTVNETKVREVIAILKKEGLVPDWFSSIRCVAWSGKIKNLEFVGSASIEEILLVDDMVVYIHPDQIEQWVSIPTYEAPYPDTDRELSRVEENLKARLQSVGNSS